ncbi:hypothetical protein [Yoonia sp.]|uniref:hypothetical protein n=1 Tax=Yoonia sp. TaxID=2212373 RepID=UPI002E06CA05|nr:hypothetical protein [Yoonia sp.]
MKPTLQTFAADMTVKQHVAVNLMIPYSGCAEIDRMIWEAKRDHIAAQIMAALIPANNGTLTDDAVDAYAAADELLAASGWEMPA